MVGLLENKANSARWGLAELGKNGNQTILTETLNNFLSILPLLARNAPSLEFKELIISTT